MVSPSFVEEFDVPVEVVVVFKLLLRNDEADPELDWLVWEFRY
jgi:hypothetical protein